MLDLWTSHEGWGRAGLRVAPTMVLMALAGVLSGGVPGGVGRAVAGAKEPPAEVPREPGLPAKESMSHDPELNDSSVDRQLDAMRKRDGSESSKRAIAPKSRAGEPTAQPAAGQSADPVPGMAASDFGVPGARRLREGAFISRRPGTLIQIPSGDWVFVPRPLAGAKGGEESSVKSAAFVDRPIVVLPSQALERLENAMRTMEAGKERPLALLSGQIFSYRDREYLLPQQPSSLVARNAGDELPGAGGVLGAMNVGGRGEKTAMAPAKELEQASVKELIKDLEARRTSPRALTPSGTSLTRPGPSQELAAARAKGGASAEVSKDGARSPAGAVRQAGAGTDAGGHAGDRAKVLVPEGTILTSRRGRVIRLAGGELAFSVDGDGQNGIEPALTLLPSATLQRLEDLILWRGEKQPVEISGRVTSYGGKNYLMPTIFVVPAGSELGPMQ